MERVPPRLDPGCAFKGGSDFSPSSFLSAGWQLQHPVMHGCCKNLPASGVQWSRQSRGSSRLGMHRTEDHQQRAHLKQASAQFSSFVFAEYLPEGCESQSQNKPLHFGLVIPSTELVLLMAAASSSSCLPPSLCPPPLTFPLLCQDLLPSLDLPLTWKRS